MAGYNFEIAQQRGNQDPYMISAQAARLGGFADAIRSIAVVGYTSDAAAGSIVDTAMFLGAQYALAPRLLDKAGKHEWVLGNFTRPGDFASVGRSNGLQLQHDFGNGVVLFQRIR